MLSFVSGVASWSFATLPRLTEAQITFTPEGSNLSFALRAPNGSAVTEQSYRGKWLVVYFGYTFCPDVCPTTMMEIAGALKALGPRADAVQAMFQREGCSIAGSHSSSARTFGRHAARERTPRRRACRLRIISGPPSVTAKHEIISTAWSRWQITTVPVPS
jgi:hypothetical protein